MKFIKIVVNVLLYPIKLLALLLILLYKKVISPLFPSSCIYTPSCSTYTMEAIKKHGLIRGFFIGFKRVLRCNSKHAGGLDPVPDNVEGDLRWII